MRRFSNEGTRLICFDFDETYFPHDCTDAQLAAVRRLEDVLEANASRVSTMWVTGSSLESIQEKARRAQLRYWPHRIAASLGRSSIASMRMVCFIEKRGMKRTSRQIFQIA